MRYSIETDLGLLGEYDKHIKDLEVYLERSAKVHDANNFFLLQTIPGVGRIIAMTLLYEIHTIKRFPTVGQVRGLGLMIGIEFVRDQTTKERAPAVRDRIEPLAFERGLLVLGCGTNTLRLCPPLVITKEQADFALDTLEECIRIASSAANL